MKTSDMFRRITGVAIWPVLCSAALAQLMPSAHWKFDESSGLTAADSAGSYTGTLAGSATFVSGGVSGNALSLDGAAGSYVDMGTSFPGFTSGDFSFSVWINSTATSGSMVFSKHQSTVMSGYFLGIGTTGDPYGSPGKAYFYGGTFPGGEVTTTSSVNDGTWHNVVATYVAGDTMRIYFDGVLEATKGSPAINANSASFLAGGLNSNTLVPTGNFIGLIDDMQVYGAALSASEVSWLYANPGSAIPEPSAYAVLAGLGALGLALRRLHRQPKV